MRYFLLVFGAVSLILLYILILATGDESILGNYFWWIVAIGCILVGILLAVLVHYILLLVRDVRHGVLGSQIARRLAGMFTLVAVLPGLFLFGVSVQFISNSINSWFGNDTRDALERGLNLSKSALNLALENSMYHARSVQAGLIGAYLAGKDMPLALAELSDAGQFNQLAVYNLQTETVDAARNPDKLPIPLLEDVPRRLLETVGSAYSIENLDGMLYAQGWLVVDISDSGRHALFFRQAIPWNVAQDAVLIEAARAKYAELTYAKQGLQTFFLLTLLMVTLLAIMLALVIALYFARRFVEPILLLAEGARAVAQGDFSQKQLVFYDDEFGRLTRLFNRMTEQLAIARQVSECNRLQQEAARHYLECILAGLSTGVVTVDNMGCLKTYNQSAEHILGMPLKDLVGTSWHHWAKQSAQHSVLTEVFTAITATVSSDSAVQLSYTAPDETRILMAKATLLPNIDDNDIVMMFDDITALVNAQKEAAWSEVAKRLAHEIRNPLTPIQLSAERLAQKLQPKLDKQDTRVLIRSTDTIIKQVAALKEMVEDFRNYARKPFIKLEPIDLKKIIEETLFLYESGECTFTADLSNMMPFILADSTAVRQVLHNVFKNAAEAASSEAIPRVHVCMYVEEASRQVVLTVANNGKGFSKKMLYRAFEPYVTDKPNGTGLGLPIVKKIIEECGGHISLNNLAEGGAYVKIILPQVEPYAQ